MTAALLAYTGLMPVTHYTALLLALLVLALAGLVLSGHRRREREQREHLRAMREREEKLRLSLWASNELYWQYDLERHELEKVQIQPGSSDDLDVRVDLDADHQINPDDVDAVLRRLRAYVAGQAPMFLSEHRIQGEDGEWQWMRARGRAVARDEKGRITRIAGTARNVSANREQERERRIATEVTRHMAEAVLVLDEEFRFVTVNPAFTRMSGFELAEVVGKDASLTNSDQHDAAFYEESRKAMRESGHWAGEMWQKRKDGREFLCAVQTNAIREPGIERRMYVLVATDITDRRRIEQELRYLANYDTLTNLPNRTLLAERLSRAIVRARRQGSCVALLFLDLDRFKDINDSLGHETGDQLLCSIGRRILSRSRPTDLVARLGGDEFALILPDLTAEVA
ncbi:MAG: diguanylate cyclase, partial [Rhodocyclaceae bacterium]